MSSYWEFYFFIEEVSLSLVKIDLSLYHSIPFNEIDVKSPL